MESTLQIFNLYFSCQTVHLSGQVDKGIVFQPCTKKKTYEIYLLLYENKSHSWPLICYFISCPCYMTIFRSVQVTISCIKHVDTFPLFEGTIPLFTPNVQNMLQHWLAFIMQVLMCEEKRYCDKARGLGDRAQVWGFLITKSCLITTFGHRSVNLYNIQTLLSSGMQTSDVCTLVQHTHFFPQNLISK